MPTRNEAFAALNSERDYQDAGRGNAKRHENAAPNLTPGECLFCIEEIAAQARAAWYKPDGGTAILPFMRKIGAVAVQCMENYGAPPRE